ncbi:hypothetical protein KP509_12G097300 [Ceratopteris richardii]|uniref:Valine--tRNA ligase, mitochondrial n=1 Tax=Ceratopteris richardii TaxID=49495 RepID=A0A8T2TLE9_CERRI|nr:hypothetical protein KP509_12G097300 [Ceratopteris richardii]
MENGQDAENLDIELERKKKKEEKAKEKELKKLKALQKAEAAKKEKGGKATKVKENKKSCSQDDDDGKFTDPPTLPGEKKNLAPEMAKSYNPAAVEAAWYEYWEKSGFFVADPTKKATPFVIVIPPPNVTGALHIGHGLTCAIEDTLVRWHRMRGFSTLWVPGVDHAGISTQVVVEKKIMKEKGLTRHDYGREKFVSEVWKWKEEYGGRICKQLRRVGASLDWTRECFTMDAQRCKAVVEAFVRLYKKGLIYRAVRLVNWDSTLKTAISDVEVDYEDIKGKTLLKVPGYEEPVEFGTLTSFAYPLEGGGEIVVATTRPETMLGDTAIAVHPDDSRYKHLHGKVVVHPFNGRKIPIICDSILVDPEFGTGAVKITPAHDPNDFAVGQRHNLEFINIFTDDGKVNSNGGEQFEGMPRFLARVAVIEALKSKGLYRKTENNDMRLAICSRSNDIIEPMIKPQWFVACNGMAKEACEAVRAGRLEIIPKQYEGDWFRWLENIRDWCISRQLWWGHRIPAWYVTLKDDRDKTFGAYDDHWIIGRNQEEVEAEVKNVFPGKEYSIAQDPDVLDTWFSSGLFPFSVMGWPENTVDLNTFYPTTLLETGHDILFFWVARMVMLGLTLTGQLPFKQIYLHAMVRDAHGRKMSKSLGNVIDPIDVIQGISLDGLLKKLEQGNLDRNEIERARAGIIADFPKGIEECGADALRFSLVAYTLQSDKINLDIQRVVGYRHWCNKLWNAIRFAMINLGKEFIPSDRPDIDSFPFSCKWILSVLNKAIAKINGCLAAYDLSGATTAVYSWWYYQLCDVFIEVSKPILNTDKDTSGFSNQKLSTQETLWICLDTGLRLLHPFMPFVTEELWQRLPRKTGVMKQSSIMVAEYPCFVPEWDFPEIESDMLVVDSIVRSLRSLRKQYELDQKLRPGALLLCRSDAIRNVVENVSKEIITLSGLSMLELTQDVNGTPVGCGVAVINDQLTVYLKLQSVVDPAKEVEKFENRRLGLQLKKETLAKQMNIAGYRDKVPQKIQAENAELVEKLTAELNAVEQLIANFHQLLHR